jgi:hypothetical protein
VSARARASVCIPARGPAPYLAAALASALAQDVDGLEVIVAGDADPGSEDPRVRHLRFRRPAGVAEARNACLAAARGSYVAWLDADDELLPGALARQLALLDAEPRVALVHGGAELVDEAGRSLPDWEATFAEDTVERDAFRQLIASNELTTSTVVARVGDERFDAAIGRSSTDWHMWLRLSLRGAVAYTVAPVARYRQHAATISRATAPSGERLRCDARVLARALREPARPAGAASIGAAGLAARALLHAGDAYTRGDRAAALASIVMAGRLGAEVARLRAATVRGDDAGCSRHTKRALGALADRLEGTRFGARLARLAAPDPAWDAQLAHAGRFAGRVTPPGAVLAAIAKWDPALLAVSGRDGCNFPDRALLGDGYPRDDAAAIAHLADLRRTRGVSHLVVPAVSGWWLEHYPALARRLGDALAADDRCAVYAL